LLKRFSFRISLRLFGFENVGLLFFFLNFPILGTLISRLRHNLNWVDEKWVKLGYRIM
jgi:hypothetical protein